MAIGSSGKYSSYIQKWDDIFGKEEVRAPQRRESGNSALDKGLQWLTEDTCAVIDFGCAAGKILFLCSLYGTKYHYGIDLSSEAIQKANMACKLMPNGVFEFVIGDSKKLKEVESSTFDAAVLSNIIDNLYPQDAHEVLSEMERIIKPNGKLLVKLNQFLTAEQISNWGISTIEGNLLDDGLLLWNNTTEEWNRILSKYYSVEAYEEIYYPEHQQTNRLFLLRNR